ncbi:hypothetical protein OG875_25365 [Streptomyces sp. NBC_01498]|uniref:hypothetical protein n=1 Tax=Streptomyces sp. NBC_01498 TaxID=2975870 RepID=UPI003FCD514F|nr:hypothetical protein OG875_25365 [Streptomyces sp. NBC_01498]
MDASFPAAGADSVFASGAGEPSLAFAVWKEIPAATMAVTALPAIAARFLEIRRCFN